MANDWMDDLAATKAKRQSDKARANEEFQKAQKELKTVVDNQLPPLKSKLGKAAEELTTRFKSKMGFTSELSCFNDPSVYGPIRLVWSRRPGAQLTIAASTELMALNVSVEPSNRDTPTAVLRVMDGELQIHINGQAVTAEKAAEQLLRPFFSYIAGLD